MGWSNGAIAALWATRLRASAARRHAGFPLRGGVLSGLPAARQRRLERAHSDPDPDRARRRLDPGRALRADGRGARGRSARAAIVVYPGAYHEFDRPDYPVRALSGLAYSADGSGRAHVGTNPAAREDSIRRVRAWLAR